MAIWKYKGKMEVFDGWYLLLYYRWSFFLFYCYHLSSRFHHQRVPLVILVCGTACVGKSTIATQLAQRLNLPNVLQVAFECLNITASINHILRRTIAVRWQVNNFFFFGLSKCLFWYKIKWFSSMTLNHKMLLFYVFSMIKILFGLH